MAFTERQGGVNKQSQSKLLAAVKEKEHKNRRKSYKQIQLETKTIGSFSAVTLDTALDDSTINNKKDNEGKPQRVTYNLSCKVCNCNHHYMGKTDTDNIMITLKELPNLLSRSLKTQQRRSSNEEGRYLYKSVLVIDESVSSHTDNTDASTVDFLTSSFAKHIINQHLQDAKGKKEVINWFKENVAIKIKTHKYEKKPSVEVMSFKAKQKPKFVIQQEEKEEEVKKVLKREEDQYKEKLVERNALTNEHVFDELWMSRYEELKQYANDNDGNTRVPANYTQSPLLHKWTQSQRDQYRRKHNIRPKKLNPEIDGGRKIILSNNKEDLLKDIGFVWFDVPKQRWDEQGILVCEGWDKESSDL